MPLLLIVRKGKKLGGFLPKAFKFKTSNLVQSDLMAYIQAIDFNTVELIQSDYKAIASATIQNSMLVSEAVAALSSGTVTNDPQVDFYLAVLPTERQLMNSGSVLDFKAIVLDQRLVTNAVENSSYFNAWLAAAYFDNSVANDSDVAVFIPSLGLSLSITEINHSHSYVVPKVYLSDLKETTIQPRPSFIVPDNFKMTAGFLSDPHTFVEAKFTTNEVVTSPDKAAVTKVTAVSSNYSNTNDIPVLGIPQSVIYTLTWYPPIPVPIAARSYLDFTMREGDSDRPIDSTANSFVMQNGIWSVRPITERSTAYVQTPSLITDRKTWIQAKTFNMKITVTTLDALTGSVASQAYSAAQTLVRDATFSTVSSTPSSGLGVLVFDSDLPSVGVAAYSLSSGGSLTDGMIANYDAGNAQSYMSGTSWYDLSGNVNTAALTNTPTYTTLNGGGLVFTGTQYGLTANNANLNLTSALTLEAVINPTALPNASYGTTVMAKGLASDTFTGSYAMCLIQSGGLQYLQFSAFTTLANLIVPKTVNVPLNRVSVLQITWDGTTVHLYVNGVEDGTGTPLTGSLQTNAYGLILGHSYNRKGMANTQGVVGTFYQAHVYSRALSVAEITQNFNNLRTRYGI